MIMLSVAIILKPLIPSYQGYDYEHYREAQIHGYTRMVAENLNTDAILQSLAFIHRNQKP